MKVCNKCQSVYSDDNNFCNKCGVALEKQIRPYNVKCRICGNIIGMTSYYCFNCGYTPEHEIYYQNELANTTKVQKDIEGKRWEMLKEEYVSLDDVTNWFETNGNRIEILSVEAGLEYSMEGLFGMVPSWHFRFIKIRYYPDEYSHNYRILCRTATDGNIIPGRGFVTSELNEVKKTCKEVVYEQFKDSRYPGGNGHFTYCGVIVYE